MFAIHFFSVVSGLQHVFVQHGKDLHLDVKKPVELDQKTDFFWKFNTSNYVGKIGYSTEAILFDSYEGRAELFKQNCSLILKTVQHNDSGDYIGIICCKLIHICYSSPDPVSPVDLTVNSSGSDSCNITVTCRTADLNISRTFRCDAQNCSQVEEKSLKQDTIVCNHSNQVSWKQSNKVIKLQCEPKPETNNTVVIVITIAVVAAVVIILAAKMYFYQRKKGMCKLKHVFIKEL
uniref:Immunoglobulin V-set domain-containing protein n=1 Tax=Amphilophus citrinellus TaxID=61819 RepID=A0A3Q0SCK8_AMPCI